MNHVQMFFGMYLAEKIFAELLENERVFCAVEGICEGLYDAALETFVEYANYQLVFNANLLITLKYFLKI